MVQWLDWNQLQTGSNLCFMIITLDQSLGWIQTQWAIFTHSLFLLQPPYYFSRYPRSQQLFTDQRAVVAGGQEISILPLENLAWIQPNISQPQKDKTGWDKNTMDRKEEILHLEKRGGRVASPQVGNPPIFQASPHCLPAGDTLDLWQNYG